MAGLIAYYVVRWRPVASDEEWEYTRLPAESQTVHISNVDRSKTYVIMAQSVGPTGLKSKWVDISHTVPGNVVPEVPQNLTAMAVADGVRLQWSFTRPRPSDVDVCIERSTSASGPWNEVLQVRATSAVVSERINGVFYYRCRTKNFRSEYSEYSAVVSGDPETLAELNTKINQALQEAENAAALADGNIQTFWQPIPPTSGMELGDIWFDTDDVSVSNPRVYRWRVHEALAEYQWILSPNDALAKALIQSNNAQTTADGKVKLFVGPNPPTSGFQLHDMWYNTTSKTLHRWDGQTWNNRIGDLVEVSSDALILNPAFSAGSTYWNLDPGWYPETSTNAAFNGGGMVRAGSADTPHARIWNQRQISVAPGQQIFGSAKLRNLGGGANGQCYAGYLFWDGQGNLLGERLEEFNEGVKLGTTEWRQIAKKFIVPHNAAYAHFTIVCYNHTVGYWCADDCRAAHVDDTTEATVNGENMVPNFNFSQNTGGWPVTVAGRTRPEMIIDGWYVEEASGYLSQTSALQAGLEANGGGYQIFVGDMGGTLAPGYSNMYIASKKKFSVVPGEKFVLDMTGSIDIGSATPAGVNRYTYMGVWGYNSAGSRIGFYGRVFTNASGDMAGSYDVDIPADVVAIQPIIGTSYHNTTGGNISLPWATSHARFRSFGMRKVVTMDDTRIRHGGIYGRIANDDLFDHLGRRRLGIGIMGSRYRVGGPRNLRTALVMGFSAVRTTGSLTADSNGNISVNAHTVHLNDEVVTYNAVTNAITGKAQGSTWVVFCLDPFMDGGTQVYFAQSTVLSAQQAGEGAVHTGTITIPSSGSSGGGGGGDVPPGDWCVDWDTYLPDGRLVRDLQVGDMVLCYDMATGETEYYPVLAIGFGEEECYRLVTPDFASIVQSASTPMDIPGGRVVKTPEMVGCDAVTLKNGVGLSQYPVMDLQCVGVRPVVKVNLGNRMYFAGEKPELCIATHNGYQKP